MSDNSVDRWSYLASVVRRGGSGRITADEYDEAIRDLQDAKAQLQPDGNNCAVCHDSGHQAWECHHNPLVMARGEGRTGMAVLSLRVCLPYGGGSCGAFWQI